MFKKMAFDSYEEKFLKFIKDNGGDVNAIVEVINKVYNDGYEDGYNEASNCPENRITDPYEDIHNV